MGLWGKHTLANDPSSSAANFELFDSHLTPRTNVFRILQNQLIEMTPDFIDGTFDDTLMITPGIGFTSLSLMLAHIGGIVPDCQPLSVLRSQQPRGSGCFCPCSS